MRCRGRQHKPPSRVESRSTEHSGASRCTRSGGRAGAQPENRVRHAHGCGGVSPRRLAKRVESCPTQRTTHRSGYQQTAPVTIKHLKRLSDKDCRDRSAGRPWRVLVSVDGRDRIRALPKTAGSRRGPHVWSVPRASAPPCRYALDEQIIAADRHRGAVAAVSACSCGGAKTISCAS